MGLHLTSTSAKLIALAGTAVLVGGSAGAGALVLAKEEDRSPATAAALVADGGRNIDETAAELEQVESLADLKRAAKAAGRRAGDVRELATRAERALAAKPILAEPVQRVLAAEAAALASVAQAASLTPEGIERWRSIAADIRRGAAEVTMEHGSLRIPPPATRPRDAGQSLLMATKAAGRYMRRAQGRLADWRRRHNKAKRKRRHELAVLDAYESTMTGYLETYDGLRSDMSDWITKVDSGGVTFDEGYEFLADASGERARVRRGIDALDAPAALAEHHNTLLAVVAASVDAVDAAYDGTIDYEFDWAGEYDSYRDAPGWRTFTEQSESVAGRYAAALAGWKAAFTKERKKTTDRALPKAPNV
jgi:hypothetical protein